MPESLVVVGAGFAGTWSALAAARVLDQAGKSEAAEIVMIAPEPFLHLRPRLHEADPGAMKTPLGPLLDVVGVRFVAGRVDRVATDEKRVEGLRGDGRRFALGYDELVLASGSEVVRPELPGLREHAFTIDQVDEAAALEAHLRGLAVLPASPARNTIVVVGGGFTGIELAAELPGRVRELWGDGAALRVHVLEREPTIGPDLGPGPRPVIEEALRSLGVAWTTGATVTSIDERGVMIANGERVEAMTVVWTAGLRASSLTASIPGDRDPLGRLRVGDDLRVLGVDGVFATGDVALATADDEGRYALMSCQHALMMGRFAGHNAASALLGASTRPYRQPFYVTCLDLGGFGAVYTEGWERTVKTSGAEAKALKRMINGQVIYPPPPDRAAALAAADPDHQLVG